MIPNRSDVNYVTGYNAGIRLPKLYARETMTLCVRMALYSEQCDLMWYGLYDGAFVALKASGADVSQWHYCLNQAVAALTAE